MTTFADLGIHPDIITGLEALGFTAPTPVQEQIIPTLLKNPVDIVGLAQTGTGKTAAFGIPLVQLCNPESRKTQALVLCPTRELCMQVARDLNAFAKNLPTIRVCAVYGGASIDNQIRSLRQGAPIIVATPGRLHDLMRRQEIDLSAIRSVVLDEADEMLQMGFQEELNAILAQTPADKHTLLFSATMPQSVASISRKYMKNPLEITVGTRNAGSENIRHIYYMVHAKDRYLALRRLVDMNPDMYAIIFCRTRQEVNDVADKLGKDGYNADPLHGELSQSQRDYVMQRFRSKSVQLLVATDVAARGLDVTDLTHVINYNLPDDSANYTHRSGRTGRAGKTGISISIIHMRERFRIKEIESKMKRQFELGRIPSGHEVCKKQLLHKIETIKNVEVNQARLAPFMDAITEALADLDRDDLILRFVSQEFDSVLAHYQNAPDINVSDKGRGQDDDYRRSESRFSRPERPDSRYARQERPESRFSRQDDRERVNFSRFYLNIGEKDGLSPARLIGQINDASGSASIKVGRIEILDNTAMLEADSRFAQKILEVFHGLKINGRDVEIKTLDSAKGRPARPAGGGYPGRNTKGPKSYKPSSSSRPSSSAKPYSPAKPYSSTKPASSSKPYPAAKPSSAQKPASAGKPATRPPSAGIPRRGKKKPFPE
ncbi:MAG: DEAD/DEAH box helicase [Desulfobulbaceae bacterium]|nr:DEAD/DEAH box helicase [Desulfobulbaceae bacterium]HIJ89882.1 DEAD/DEAH box helicase [Deltaproteobacteria bacterium]